MPKHARSAPGYTPQIQNSTIDVFDDRPELGNPMRLVATFKNVPADWTGKHVLEYFGIAEHLHVVRREDRKPEVIQPGRR